MFLWINVSTSRKRILAGIPVIISASRFVKVTQVNCWATQTISQALRCAALTQSCCRQLQYMHIPSYWTQHILTFFVLLNLKAACRQRMKCIMNNSPALSTPSLGTNCRNMPVLKPPLPFRIVFIYLYSVPGRVAVGGAFVGSGLVCVCVC